jgi:hypothetical protein
VNGIADGTANIKAVYGGITVLATVVSKTRTIKDLTIFPGAGSLSVGNRNSYTVKASYTDGTTNVDVTEDAIFTIDNTNIALLADAINQPGQVVAVDTGTATLTASFGGLSKTLTLTVP